MVDRQSKVRVCCAAGKVLVALIFLACSALWTPGRAQHSTASASQGQDSLAAQTLFELALIRVQRLVPEYWSNTDTVRVDPEVRSLLQEALQLAEQKQWAAAEALLSVVADYLAAERSWRPAVVGQDDRTALHAQRARWYPELFTGVEAWEQRFVLPGEVQDSTFGERAGNPLFGLRLGVERGSPSSRLLDGALELRTSRDYQAGRLSAGYRLRFAGGHHLALEEELEGMSFRDAISPDYVRNNVRCELAYALVPELTAVLGYRGYYQHYGRQDQFYASFVSHRLNGELAALAAPGTRLSVGYGYEHCRYPSWHARDYQDHRLNCRLFHRVLLVEGAARYRHFASPFADSLYNNDYLEADLRADWRKELLSWFGVVFRLELVVRDYKYATSSTPDYRLVELTPGVLIPLAGLTIQLGYQVRRRTPSPAAPLNDPLASIDEYLAQGPTLSLEFTGPRGMLLSANASVGTVAYPSDAGRDASGLSFFSDRRASSVMCFFTWPVSTHWEANLFANYDADLDAKEDLYDSRSSLLTFEVRYRF